MWDAFTTLTANPTTCQAIIDQARGTDHATQLREQRATLQTTSAKLTKRLGFHNAIVFFSFVKQGDERAQVLGFEGIKRC